MREYSSSIDEIEERIDTMKYKLALVNYLIENIGDREIEKNLLSRSTTNDSLKKEWKKEDMILFYREINKLLRGSSDMINIGAKGGESNATNNSDDVCISQLREYLPILKKLKMSQEGEIILLERRKRNHFVDG